METRRNTYQRQLILDAVRELNIHASAEQVYEYVVKKHPMISKATVYRNLSQMADAGELLNIGSFHGSAHYDHNCHEHYHFACNNCRRIFDIPAFIPNICDDITGMGGFDVRGYNLSFNGLCGECVSENMTGN